MKMILCLPPIFTGDTSALDAARKLRNKIEPRQHLLMVDEPRSKRRGSKCPIKIAGKTYESIRAAAAAHKTTTFTVHKWIESGKAVYVES